MSDKPILTISEEAVQKLQEIISEDENGKEVVFRVWVSGGGCSGLQYGFAVDTEGPEAEDKLVEQDGIKVIIDPLSLTYMEGSEIQYAETAFGGGFKIENPNAVSSCGCGNSFKAEGGPSAGCGGCNSCG